MEIDGHYENLGLKNDGGKGLISNIHEFSDLTKMILF